MLRLIALVCVLLVACRVCQGHEKPKILRVPFRELEKMRGRKVVLFISGYKQSQTSADAMKTLRGVRDGMDAKGVPVSFVRVDCNEKSSKEKCSVAQFSSFPRWFIHTEQGGIEELWNPQSQTIQSIIEYFKFRTNEEKIEGASVHSLSSFTSLTDLTNHRPVVMNFMIPWSGRSKRFRRHYEKISSIAGNSFFFYAINCENMSTLCLQEQIETYPTIKIFFQDDAKDVYSTDYNGIESFDALNEHLTAAFEFGNRPRQAKKVVIPHLSETTTSDHSMNGTPMNSILAFEGRFKKWMVNGFKKMEKSIVRKVSNAVVKSIHNHPSSEL